MIQSPVNISNSFVHVFRNRFCFGFLIFLIFVKRPHGIPTLGIECWRKWDSPYRRRSGDNTWLCRLDLSWAARPAAPVVMLCRQNRGYDDDRYRRPNTRMAWQLRAAERRSRLVAAGPLPSTPYPRAHRRPAMAIAPRYDCRVQHRSSTSSFHLSMSATKLWTFINSSEIWSVIRVRFSDRCWHTKEVLLRINYKLRNFIFFAARISFIKKIAVGFLNFIPLTKLNNLTIQCLVYSTLI